MLEAGEDRLYIARRLVRMAIEDIGLADPRALEQAIAAMQAVHFMGVPEGDQALAQAAIYLSLAPKSDAAYQALNGASRPEVPRGRTGPAAPAQSRHTVHEGVGIREGYQHAHQFEDAVTDMECLPASLAGHRFYFPTDRGMEKRVSERLENFAGPKAL